MNERTDTEGLTGILVVDDDASSLIAIEAALAPLGLTVTTARSGHEALRLLLKQGFALILLDVAMPVLDGFVTAKMIRESVRHRHTPIAFLTGQRSAELVARGYSVGAVDYITKPVDPEILRGKVHTLIRLFRGLAHSPDEPQAGILIVEDNPANMMVFKSTLSLLGEHIVTAQSGEEALLLLEQEEIAVLLLDVRLPGIDGFATAAAIMNNPRTHGLPIIMISAIAHAAEDLVRGYTFGVVDYLFTPVEPAMLRAKVAVFVELFKKRERIRRQEEQFQKLERANSDLRNSEERLQLVEQNQRMREQLMLADRMASIGTLAAGVAHEINNPLAAVIANIDFSGEELAQIRSKVGARLADREGGKHIFCTEWLESHISKVCSLLTDTRESAERIRQIVADIKIFSRPDEELYGPVDIHRVLDSTLRMCWNELQHRSRIVKDYGAIQHAEGNAARLGQVFLNLLINASQAIQEGACEANEIRITTRMDHAGRVTVEVRDTGCGIPAENLARIYDPFFSTKAIGTGTGLGLAICRRIISSQGGEITVESEVGKGATFRVALPAGPAVIEELPTPAPPTHATRRGSILVVDDEAMIRQVVRLILATEHDVVEAVNGRAALERIHAGERFDVILCDLMMPEMTGVDLHEELSRTAPLQAERMIFITGGVFSLHTQEFLDRCPNPKLDKPFDYAKLRALVNERVSGDNLLD